jgi:general secretion pathway protein G
MIQRNETRRQRRSAFTLMEMLIVVAIIVALAGIGGFFIMGQLFGAQKDAAVTQMKSLTQVCDAYKIKHMRWPNQLNDLLVKDEFGMVWVDDPQKLIDPWGHPYGYDANGTRNQGLHVDIFCTPQGENEMIGNWPTKKLQQ